MKRFTSFLTAIILAGFFSVSMLHAQEAGTGMVSKTENPFSVGADVYSSYVWRGVKFSGPSFQPYLEASFGNFTIGSWGSFDFIGGFAEADIYASYAFDFGLSLGVTDYYYPGTSYFEFSDSLGAHALEINAGYEIGGLSIGANYIVNEAGGAASAGGDMYFELGYSFDNFSLFVGGGDGWHTSDGEFMITNVGISSEKEIKVSETFSLPVSGAVILNPEMEQFFVVVGISF
ncbi:MAG: hypothetical protein ACOCVN_01030 [bacterium]